MEQVVTADVTRVAKDHDKKHMLEVLDAFDHAAQEYSMMLQFPRNHWPEIIQKYHTTKRFLQRKIEEAFR